MHSIAKISLLFCSGLIVVTIGLPNFFSNLTIHGRPNKFNFSSVTNKFSFVPSNSTIQ
ncbi:unnamed protein product [Meloidogyne enterolobii]|uniref:Uncharacterized protein n=1 Tax=Meloidogyne enterolobii TaxID=390850 RepID=A0ACB1A590_MELEN